MERRGLPRAVTDASVLERTVERFREAGVALPTFGELANPTTIPDRVTRALETVEPDAAHPLNLFRVHWYNGADRVTQVDVPDHLELPRLLKKVRGTWNNFEFLLGGNLRHRFHV